MVAEWRWLWPGGRESDDDQAGEGSQVKEHWSVGEGELLREADGPQAGAGCPHQTSGEGVQERGLHGATQPGDPQIQQLWGELKIQVVCIRRGNYLHFPVKTLGVSPSFSKLFVWSILLAKPMDII